MTWNVKEIDDQRIAINDLQPGDRMIALSFTDDAAHPARWFDPWNREFVFVKMGDDPLRVVVTDPHKVMPTCRISDFNGNRANAVWIRGRKFTAPPVTAEKYRNDTRWNGKCRCGANTYTSCFSVDHEGECRP